MIEIRQQGLRFSLPGTATLARGWEEDALAPAVLQALLARTEGWAAGLRIAVAARARRGGTLAPVYASYESARRGAVVGISAP